MQAVFDASSQAGGTSTSLSWSHTVGSGDNRLLLVGISIHKESNPRPAVTLVTWRGVPLRQAGVHPNTVKTGNEFWYLVAPSSGVGTIAITLDNTPTGVVGGATSWSDVDQSEPIIAFNSTGTGSATPSLTVASGGGRTLVSCVATVAAVTFTGVQTSRWTTTGGAFLRGAGGSSPDGGNVAMSWSMGGAQEWTLAVVTIQGATDGVVFTAQVGDSLSIRPELWIVSKDNEFLEEITDQLVDGSIDMNVDRDIPMAASLLIRDPENLLPFAQYLAPRLAISYSDGRDSELRQLGLYAFAVPPGEFTLTKAEVMISGSDMTSVLGGTSLLDTYNIAAGTNVRTSMIALLAYAGITRYRFPESTVTFAKKRSYLPGVSVLEAVNECCDTLGWYHVSADLEGYISTPGEIRDLATIDPFATYTPDDIRSNTLSIAPSNLQVVNTVVAVNTNNAEAPLTSTAVNDDPNSPTSTVTLGRALAYPGGPIQVQGEITQANLDAVARRYLRDGRSYYRTATMAVLPDPDGLIPQQTLRLDLDGKMTEFSGLWYIRTARMGFNSQSALLVFEINQTTTFTGQAL